MWQVIESAATFVQGIIYFWFLSRLLDSKYDRRTTDIGVLVTAVIYMLADRYSEVILGRYSRVAFYVVILTYVFLSFKNTVLDKIYGFIVIEVIIAFVAQFLVHLFSSVYHVKPVELINQQKSIERLIVLFLAQVLSFVIAKVVIYMTRQWGNVWKDKKVTIVSLSSIMVIWGLQKMVYLGEAEPTHHRIFGIFAGVLFINILVLYIVWKLYRHEEEIRRYEIQLQNVEEVHRMYEESRKLRHNIKNILLVSIGYLESGQPEKALLYLKSIEEENLRIEQPIVCENEELSYILTVKRQKCKEKDILFHYIISAKLEEISGKDLSILLGNLLDNAIEGIDANGERKIDLHVQEQHGYYKITVQNSIDRTVLGNNRQLFTTKENTYEHGFGIKSVKTVVDKYNGICEFSEEEGVFTAEVLLPIEKE